MLQTVQGERVRSGRTLCYRQRKGVVRERRKITDSARRKVVVRESRVVLDCARRIGVGGERCDVTDRARGKGFVGERRVVTVQSGKWSLVRNVMLQSGKGETGRSGET